MDLRTPPDTRLYRETDLGRVVALFSRIGGATMDESTFLDVFERPAEGRSASRDVVVATAPDGSVSALGALYREDEFFTALGPWVDPGADVEAAAHAVLGRLEALAAERGWRALRFEVEEGDGIRVGVLRHRGYGLARTYLRMARAAVAMRDPIALGGLSGPAGSSGSGAPGGPGAPSSPASPIVDGASIETLAQHAERRGGDPASILGDLLDGVFLGSWQYRRHGREGAEARLARAGAGPDRVILALEGRDPVGFLEWSGEGEGAFLDDIGVLPAGRGRGWGRQLVVSGITAMAEAGARRVDLDVDAANEPAIALYESLDFRPTGRVLYLELEVSQGSAVDAGRGDAIRSGA